jgi:phosphoglycerate dehydrogenase-like enzyme
MMKLLLNTQWPEHLLAPVREAFPQVNFVQADDAETALREIADADAVFGYMTEDLSRAAKNLRWVQAMSAGVEWIWDTPTLQHNDAVLTHMRGSHAATIAEHTFAMLLSMSRRLGFLAAEQRRKSWQWGQTPTPMFGLSGLTMGIIGLGNIGRAIARRARAFDMNVIAVDINDVPQPDYVDQLSGMDGLPDLLRRADTVAIATPLTPQSRGMITADHLGMMKPTAHLLVLSRGKIVDEAALIAALKEQWIAGACLDVQAEEPMSASNPLWDAPNLIITPHNSAQSEQTMAGGTAIFRENLGRFLAGETLTNLVDKSRGY